MKDEFASVQEKLTKSPPIKGGFFISALILQTAIART